jgi:hypothetical protein
VARVVTKEFLSASTHGSLVKVAATATAGTTVHTAIAGTTSFDEVFLYVTNTDTTARTLTIEWSGVTDPDNLILKAVTIPASSYRLPIIRGEMLRNTLVIGAFASAANVLLIGGYCLRTTVS